MNNGLRRYGIPLLLLALLLAVVGFSGVLGTYVVEPVAALLWAGWRVIASVDQSVYWILLIVLCSLLTIRVFSTRGPQEALPENQGIPLQRTRVEHWQNMFEHAARTREGDAALRESLRSLLESVIAQEGQPPPRDFKLALSARHISLPASVQGYLAADEQGRSRSLLTRTRNALRRWLRIPESQDDSTVDEVLRWMETAMEMSHD